MGRQSEKKQYFLHGSEVYNIFQKTGVLYHARKLVSSRIRIEKHYSWEER
jgi:hypothetical protein